MPGRKSNRVMGPSGWDCGLGILRCGGQGSLLEEMAFELSSYDGKKPARGRLEVGGSLEQREQSMGL